MDLPATLTAVGVVSTIAHGPFQVGDNICRFQSFTHTKYPDEYGCVIVTKEKGILS